MKNELKQKRQKGFRVPENYFDGFQVSLPQRKQRKIYPIIASFIATAAVVAGLILSLSDSLLPTSDALSSNVEVTSSYEDQIIEEAYFYLDEEEIIAYISENNI